MNTIYTFSQLKEYPGILNGYKRMDKVLVKCDLCNKVVSHRNKKEIAANIRKNRSGFFCSNTCAHENRHLTKTIITKCTQCGIEVKKRLSHFKRGIKNTFCSKSCNCRYSNSHKTKGLRRSKLELFIQEQLTLLFPILEIHYNHRDAINSELDLYIPSFKLAIELNGIFHYEPIYGNETLSKIQNNDTRKIQACIERGIEFCIIDVSHIKYFKESTSLPILKLVTDLIEMKLSLGPLGIEPSQS